MQRRVAQESAERDAARLVLHRLKTSVDFYRQRLQTTLGKPSTWRGEDHGLTQRVRDLIRDMEGEVRGVLNEASRAQSASHSGQPALPGSPKKGSYNVLRQSLDEAQRRCESLNMDMVHQAEANEELVETLSTVKDANKRLLEQIRGQTDEISRLTQLRVGDEEKIEKLARQHEFERDHQRNETTRAIDSVRGGGTEKHDQIRTQLLQKLRTILMRADAMGGDVDRLVHELQDRRNEVIDLSSIAEFSNVQHEIMSRCDHIVQEHKKWTKKKEASIEDLNHAIKAEHDARLKDNLAWNLKNGALTTEKEHVQACMTRELSKLGSQLQALERTVRQEQQVAVDERDRLEHQLDDDSHKKNQYRGELDQLQRDVVSLESAISAASSEIAGSEQVISELRRQIRESDDALAAALSGNEHLQEQMEEQRARFHDKNESDLDECRRMYEKKIADARHADEAHAAMAAKQWEAMEHDLKFDDAEIARVHNQIQALSAEGAALSREIAEWRSQCEAAHSGREGQEHDTHAQKQHYQAERLKLQFGVDTLTSHIMPLEEDRKRAATMLQECRRGITERQAKGSTKHKAAENVLKEAQDNLADLRARLRDATEQRNKALEEASSSRERMQEILASLESSVSSQARIADEERRRLVDVYNKEHANTEHVRDELDRERESSMHSLRRMHDESRDKLAGAERECARLEHSSRLDIAQAAQLLGQQQKRAESLEHDVGRMRALLHESEANLSWIRQEREHEEREAAVNVRHLEDEVNATNTALSSARRDDAALSQQLDMQRQRNEQDRTRLRQMLDAVLNGHGSSSGALEPSHVGTSLTKPTPMTAR